MLWSSYAQNVIQELAMSQQDTLFLNIDQFLDKKVEHQLECLEH